jgi:hypothetical protein
MRTSRVLTPLLLTLLGSAGPSLADESVAAVAAAAARSEVEEPAVSQALPAAVPKPRWSMSGAAEQGGYRLSLSRGALDLGMRFEPPPAAARPNDARFDSTAPVGVTLPALSLGLRSIAAGPATASSLAERALGGAAPAYEVSKVGIEWKPAQSQVFFHQGIGFRLGEDERLTMRLRKGSFGLYMQRKF